MRVFLLVSSIVGGTSGWLVSVLVGAATSPGVGDVLAPFATGAGGAATFALGLILSGRLVLIRELQAVEEQHAREIKTIEARAERAEQANAEFLRRVFDDVTPALVRCNDTTVRQLELSDRMLEVIGKWDHSTRERR